MRRAGAARRIDLRAAHGLDAALSVRGVFRLFVMDRSFSAQSDSAGRVCSRLDMEGLYGARLEGARCENRLGRIR